MNDDQRAFEQFAQAHGVHYAKQAAQLADYDKGESMDVMLSGLLEQYPTLKEARLHPKEIGGPLIHGEHSAVIALRTDNQALKVAAAKAKASGKIEDRVAYAQLARGMGR